MKYLLSIVFCLVMSLPSQSQELEQQATGKITILQDLIEQGNEKGLDTSREEMTIHIAKLFLKYATWDENNIETNTKQFEAHAKSEYKNKAKQKATELPDFERKAILSILDKSIKEITSVLNGNLQRKPTPTIDWAKVEVEQNRLTYEGRPVFLADYTWKANTTELQQYLGACDSEGLRTVYITDEEGNHESWNYRQWQAKGNANIGALWTDQNNVPDWAKKKWPDIQVGGRHYGKFDVDHAGSREMYSLLYKHYVPLLAGKNVTKLGYQLWNEPSFFTLDNCWNNKDDNGVCVSDSTRNHFKTWLKNKHKTIGALNALWKTNFEDFSQVEITLPLPKKYVGQPIGYDWMAFNMDRITNWFTFMHDEIVKYDPEARVHIKLMPWTWAGNARDHGLDFEALTHLSGISGCDAGMQYLHNWDSEPWKTRYSMNWYEALMTFDFFKSVQPDHFIYDTENHFLMNTGFTEQELNQEYIRAAYWLGTMHGLTAKSTWVWTREADGSMKRSPAQSNMTDVSHQPEALHTITSTYMNLNSFSEELYAIQTKQKPVRVFYSKTSAINTKNYMDDILETYESVFFDGLSVGFVTKDILNRRGNWSYVLIRETPYVTQDEQKAIEAYLEKGGTVLIDQNSLKRDEYGRDLPALSSSNGTIIQLNSLKDFKDKHKELMKKFALVPSVQLTETNENNLKAVNWKCIKNEKGNNVLCAINMGIGAATITVSLTNAKHGAYCTDLLTGKEVSATKELNPYEIYFVEITDNVPTSNATIQNPSSTNKKEARIFPNPTTGVVTIDYPEVKKKINLQVRSTKGELLQTFLYQSAQTITTDLSSLSKGIYLLHYNTDGESQTEKIILR